MAIGVIWYPEVDQETYEAISDRVMQPGAAKGMRFHAAGEGEGQWRISRSGTPATALRDSFGKTSPARSMR
jgi:hypothetical protein